LSQCIDLRMAEARGFRKSSSCGAENKLKVIKLKVRKIEKESVGVMVTLEGIRRVGSGTLESC